MILANCQYHETSHVKYRFKSAFDVSYMDKSIYILRTNMYMYRYDSKSANISDQFIFWRRIKVIGWIC